MGTHTILVASINGASKLNFVTTLSKVLGFVFFIVAGLFVFQTTLFDHFYFPIQGENGTSIGIGGQVHNAAISTLWAFVGIESAVILSGRASSQRDVKRATITGLLIALSIYIIVTLITMGVLPHDKLVGSEKPFVDVLYAIVGNAGSVIMALWQSFVYSERCSAGYCLALRSHTKPLKQEISRHYLRKRIKRKSGYRTNYYKRYVTGLHFLGYFPDNK